MDSESSMWSVKNWRRQRILRRNQLDEELWQRTVAELPLLHNLSEAALERLRELVVLFLHDKIFYPKLGLEMDDSMRVMIAAQACLPILNLGFDYYHGWRSIIVYPEGFVAPHDVRDAAGVVHHIRFARAGEAWEGGPIVLSWHDILEAGNGYNVVIHEFAHKLDLLSGHFNGLPPLHDNMNPRVWAQVFGRAYQDFCQRNEAGLDTVFDGYAATSPGEFFAVMSEAFFDIPQQLRARYPLVYDQLRAFYRQDPAARLALRPVSGLTVPS